MRQSDSPSGFYHRILNRALGDSDLKELLKAKPLYDIVGNPLGYSEILIRETFEYTKIMTDLFERGEIEILIGTKSLLGEGSGFSLY